MSPSCPQAPPWTPCSSTRPFARAPAARSAGSLGLRSVAIDPKHLAQLARSTVPPMHPAGRPFVLGLLAAALVGRRIWRPAGTIGAVAAAACAAFFREPVRVP